MTERYRSRGNDSRVNSRGFHRRCIGNGDTPHFQEMGSVPIYAFIGIGTGSFRVGIGATAGELRPFTRSATFTAPPVRKLLLADAPIKQEYSPLRSSAARRYLSSSAVPNTSVSMTLSPPP